LLFATVRPVAVAASSATSTSTSEPSSLALFDASSWGFSSDAIPASWFFRCRSRFVCWPNERSQLPHLNGRSLR
jgi:hypothetical protein